MSDDHVCPSAGTTCRGPQLGPGIRGRAALTWSIGACGPGPQCWPPDGLPGRARGILNKDLVDRVIDTAQRVASGAISANGHGNDSLRLPGAAEMYPVEMAENLRVAALQRSMTFADQGTVRA